MCRGGLTVEEVFTILKTLGYRNTREVKSYDWLQFINCSGTFLHEKANGLLDFSHQHLKEIVEYVLLRKYLSKRSIISLHEFFVFVLSKTFVNRFLRIVCNFFYDIYFFLHAALQSSKYCVFASFNV